ncbi:uncharacterized protein [Ranitomeya imitator]|uniref:uncharacterized protein n=1 Tax=Ranitomeya imitator TaxID=111125 RepID=UPI0037E7BACD
MAGQLLRSSKYISPSSTYLSRLLDIRLRAGFRYPCYTPTTFFRPTTTLPAKKTTRRGHGHRRRLGPREDHEISGTNPLVINISDRLLGVAEYKVLQKGLSFCPSYQCHTFDLEMDLQRFFRTLRLKAFFSTSPEPPSIQPSTVPLDYPLSSRSLGLYTKSHFRPPHGSHAMESFIGFIKESFKSLCEDIRRGRLFFPPNLSSIERQALWGLQNDSSLIFKPADKGGALVIMNRSDYLNEIKRQLDNSTVYVKLQRDPIAAIRQIISDTLLKYTELGVLDPKTREFLTNSHPITPVFYTIPKIHKNLEKPPGRPIVASTDSILSPLAIYLEKILTPLIRSSKSFILDTGSFLNILKDIGPIPPHSTLVTMDVKDLYTSIPHIEGINSVHKLLIHSGLLPDQINLCIELLTIILTRNYFLFQDDFYLQIRGTAMGSNVAPPYANCYMADFEESQIYSHPLFRDNVIVWRRYIDDVFCIWGGSLEALASFFDWLNTAWPGISFTMSHNTTQINFLDTMVILQPDGSITTDLYTKSTDRNSLLHFTSFHPPATKNSVPKSQFHRVSKIVSDTELRPVRLQEMATKFAQRGYPPSVLEKAAAPSPPRPNRASNRIPFVHSYHPFAYILRRSIRQNWHLLSKAYPNVVEFQNPFLPCFKRPPNLKDSLVRADLGPGIPSPCQRFLQSPRTGTFPCLNCSQCHNVLKGSSFHHPRSGKSYRIPGYFTCASSWVIYLIKCSCGLLYVGETTQPIRDRVSKHKSTVRCKNLLLPIPLHFNNHGHNVSQLQFQVIEHIPPIRRGGDRVARLKRREAFWIHTLETLHPLGLNRDYDLASFL